MTSYIKGKRCNTLNNLKSKLFGDRDELINHIREYSRLQKEYMIRHEWVGKLIHWELSKTLKVCHNGWILNEIQNKGGDYI